MGSADADVRDAAAVESLVERHRPDAIVHTAYVQSDRSVTADGAAHVAGAAARHGARMVLVSSDVVFGGSDRPYDETAPTDPVSPYGEAKVAAERAVLDTCADAVVARTSLILGDGASQHEELVRRLAAGADGASSRTSAAARSTSRTSPAHSSSSPRATCRASCTWPGPTA